MYRSEDVDLEKEFEQNELNSAVYLISITMQISNFAINYKVSTYVRMVPVLAGMVKPHTPMSTNLPTKGKLSTLYSGLPLICPPLGPVKVS